MNTSHGRVPVLINTLKDITLYMLVQKNKKKTWHNCTAFPLNSLSLSFLAKTNANKKYNSNVIRLSGEDNTSISPVHFVLSINSFLSLHVCCYVLHWNKVLSQTSSSFNMRPGVLNRDIKCNFTELSVSFP